MEEQKYYRLKIAGLERELPFVRVGLELSIASFVMMGDTKLIEAVAEALFNHPAFPRDDIEMLACPEAKAIPLTHALAVRMGVDYAVLRKMEKSYMRNPIVEQTKSITTDREQILVLDEIDRDRLRGKRVCIVDDVVSTGGSLTSAEKLLSRVPCTVSARVTALLEDGGYSPIEEDRNLIYLERLPIFE
jgi:adenine phosphoribosyltransferase